ncbi:MAG: hypothetical protein Q9164_003284 [Protoblastenia rupestris]
MAPQAASIQSFFQPETSSPDARKQILVTEADANNGFTSTEVNSALCPNLHKWQPRIAYADMDIGALAPGPGCVTIMGRIVNFYETPNTSKSPRAAKGSYSVVVKDDTGAFTVKLCCGVPIFANAIATKCKHCENDVPLRINPRLIGLLVDESGSITSGKLVWSDEAWWQLLGRTTEELAGSDAILLKYLEQRLLFLRLAVMFGWSADIGKLAILRVGII